MTRETGRFDVGPCGSVERRLAERQAIIDVHLELALGAVMVSLESGWIGPEHSPLGTLRHVAAVLRRIARRSKTGKGPIDATIIAGRHLLTIDAVADEWFRPRRGSRLEKAIAGLARRPGNDNAGSMR